MMFAAISSPATANAISAEVVEVFIRAHDALFDRASRPSAALKIEVPDPDEVRDRRDFGIQERSSVRPLSQSVTPSFEAATTESAAISTSAPAIGNAGRSYTYARFRRDANMAEDRAALLRQPRHVHDQRVLVFQVRGHTDQRANGQNTGSTDTRDSDVPGTDPKFGQCAGVVASPERSGLSLQALAFFSFAATHGDEGRTEPFQAGESPCCMRTG